MLVAIRADASQTIGSGHIMRCLTLAERLKVKGAEVSFICRDFQGNLAEYIRNNGFEVHLLSRVESGRTGLDNSELMWLGTDWKSDADETIVALSKYRKKLDWIIVDHYGIDYKWQTYMKTQTGKIMVIDDTANRQHNCDILLDQNLFENPASRYLHLLPKGCKMLLGPHYSLLRSEFRNARLNSPNRDGRVQRLMVFFGGSDPANETLKTLQALQNLSLSIDVIVGKINPYIKKINEFVTQQENMNLYCDVNNMAQLMIKADLAIGASGSTSWERCCVGLPMILISVAENQEGIAENLEKQKSAVYLGKNTEIKETDILKAVKFLMQNPLKVKELSQNARQLVDGYGAERVSNILLSNT